ncbi:MAG TPA: carboxypeptidase-like regulatory domain-containing protein [Mucilaginibacter sp.]
MKYFFVFFLCLMAGLAGAQGLLKGTVYESGTNNRLPNVFVRDNMAKQYTLTDKQGNFEIRTEPGHLLIFDSPGYVSDTLYVVDMTAKKIMLETKTIALREVNISATRPAFNPQKEYPEVYQKSKLYVLSPTTWFGKEAKDARRLKRYFKNEAEERHVDEVFNRAYVGSIVPLKGQELEDFMTMYRPSYAFVTSNNGPSLAAYINDSYKKFKALPPEKRRLQRLTDTTRAK